MTQETDILHKLPTFIQGRICLDRSSAIQTIKTLFSFLKYPKLRLKTSGNTFCRAGCTESHCNYGSNGTPPRDFSCNNTLRSKCIDKRTYAHSVNGNTPDAKTPCEKLQRLFLNDEL